VSEEGTELVHERHFTREEANALLPQLTTLLGELREAKDELTETIEQSGIVLRDIDRGLVDFPAIFEDREVYLCWELGEDDVAFWHDLDGGYGGREPLD
jgi:hypothetical protein